MSKLATMWTDETVLRVVLPWVNAIAAALTIMIAVWVAYIQFALPHRKRVRAAICRMHNNRFLVANYSDRLILNIVVSARDIKYGRCDILRPNTDILLEGDHGEFAVETMTGSKGERSAGKMFAHKAKLRRKVRVRFEDFNGRTWERHPFDDDMVWRTKGEGVWLHRAGRWTYYKFREWVCNIETLQKSD